MPLDTNNPLIQERLKKLETLKEKNINPYPQGYNQTHHAQDILTQYKKLKKEETTKDSVSIAGRITQLRRMGKATFLHILDRTGKIQAYLREEDLGKETYEQLKLYDIGDIIGIKGTIFATKTGEITVHAKNVQLLTKGLIPLPEKWHGLQDKEERYRKRYLDLISNEEVRNVFETRAKIIDSIRSYLKEHDFLEVEVPALQTIYGGASAQPFTTHLNALNMDIYLSISPELYLKRLIVGGYERVFTICKNFRNEGIDKQHNPEFTMLEFYQAYATYEDLMKMTEELLTRMLTEIKGTTSIEYQGQKLNFKTFKRITFKDLINKETGIDIDKENNYEKLANAITKKKLKDVNIQDCKHYGALLDELYKRVCRPKLIQPTFLTNYPTEMIALAKRNEQDPSKINSVQLLVAGAEVFKAYDELNDPQDQEARLLEQQEHKEQGDTEAMPLDEDFIEALNYGMPPTAGYGLGIDRLTMILTDQHSIRDVILFPFMKPEK